MEDEFRDWAELSASSIQAYLPEARGRPGTAPRTGSKQRGTPIWIRLVKGAYWDYETVDLRVPRLAVPGLHAEVAVGRQLRAADASSCSSNRRWLRPAIASHNLRSLAHAIAWSRGARACRTNAWEIQMLYGMAEEQAATVQPSCGHRVRIYTPFGELIPGMAYLVRRLLENTSNDSFLRHAYDESTSVEDLFRRPADVGELQASQTAVSA